LWLSEYGELKAQWRELGSIRFFPDFDVKWPSVVGMALDYRIRFFFEHYDAKDTVAARGAYFHKDSFAKIRDGIEKLLNTEPPQGRILSDKAEELLLQYCYVLALYEVDARASWYDSPLRTLRHNGVKAQLNRVPQNDLLDLKELTVAAHRAFEPLMGQPFHLNPTFSDSPLVHGADGDIIVGRNLIEIKAEKDGFRSNRIRQVVIYALLDSIGEYDLDECSIYMARWGKLLTWNLDNLIRQMSDGRFNYVEFRLKYHDWLLEVKRQYEQEETRQRNLDEILKPGRDELRRISEEHQSAREKGDRNLQIDESRRESGTVIPLRGLLHVRNSPILTRAA